jgi:replication factor A1
MACPTDGCNKKVVEEGPAMYRCEKCAKVYDHCQHRFIFSMQIADHTGATWINVFNETGEELLGKNAEELYYLKQNDETSYAFAFKEPLFKPLIFKLRAKQETYQGESKLRCNVMAAIPINAEDECKFIIENFTK